MMLSNCPRCNSPMTSAMTWIKRVEQPVEWNELSTPQQCIRLVNYCNCFECHYHWEEDTNEPVNKGIIERI